MRFFRSMVLVPFTLLLAVPWADAQPNWLRIRSPHFQVITDAGQKRGAEVARRCEQMRAIFSKLMAKATVEDPAPLSIIALQSQTEVDDFTSDNVRKLRHAGIFLPGPDESSILADVSGDPWHTVYHEYAHELLHANTGVEVPAWFEEGFAEYFSTLDLNSKHAEIGEVPLGELEFLRQNGKLMRLADLEGVNQQSRIYNQNGPEQALFYAQSWLLVHFLFDHQLINRAQSFFSARLAGVSLDQAIVDVFGMKREVLEQNLLAYAHGGQFRYFALPTVGIAEWTETNTEAVSETAAAALKLRLHWRENREHSGPEAQAAVKEYKKLLAKDPNNALVLRYLGLALMENGDYAEAFSNLHYAVELEPTAVNHHAFAQLFNTMDAHRATGAHPGASLEQEAEACVKLDPYFADAYRILAEESLRNNELEKASALMRKAVDLSPRMESYELEMADIELQTQDYGSAVALLHQLANSRDPDVAKKAEYFLSSDRSR